MVESSPIEKRGSKTLVKKGRRCFQEESEIYSAAFFLYCLCRVAYIEQGI